MEGRDRTRDMRYFTDQALEEALRKVPGSIREALESGDTLAETITDIGRKYALHIDSIGVVAELNRNMLLGLVGPDEFLKELIAIGIPDMSAKQIMADINQKIFIPLRQQIRTSAPAPQPQKSVMPQQRTPALPPRPMNAGVPTYAPPPQSPKYFHAENKSVPTAVIQPIQQAHPSVPVAAPTPPPNVLPRPAVPPTNTVPRTPTPLGQALRAVVPGLPATNTQPPESDFLPPPAPKAPPQPAQYSADPYREPIQ